MILYLGCLIFAFVITGLSIVPYIDYLYLSKPKSPPPGGGVLVVSIVTLLYSLLFPLFTNLGIFSHSVFPISKVLTILFLTFISFSSLGLISEVFKLDSKYRWVMVLGLSFIVSCMLGLFLNVRIINISQLGVLRLGLWIIPISTLLIFVFAHGTWVSDKIDGLSNGLLLISLLMMWAISVNSLDTAISTFIALWVGSLIALLYFNVYPARIVIGSSGTLAFGATLVIIGLLLGKVLALLVIAAPLILNSLWKLLFKLPLHDTLLGLGWPIPKIMMRAWLTGVFLGVFGLWLALL